MKFSQTDGDRGDGACVTDSMISNESDVACTSEERECSVRDDSANDGCVLESNVRSACSGVKEVGGSDSSERMKLKGENRQRKGREKDEGREEQCGNVHTLGDHAWVVFCVGRYSACESYRKCFVKLDSSGALIHSLFPPSLLHKRSDLSPFRFCSHISYTGAYDKRSGQCLAAAHAGVIGNRGGYFIAKKVNHVVDFRTPSDVLSIHNSQNDIAAWTGAHPPNVSAIAFQFSFI